MNLVLASQSPRRKELLAQLGYQFTTCPANIDETPKTNESPAAYVERMAKEKALAAAKMLPNEGIELNLVLGSDTSVVCQNQILGKPESYEDFKSMMALLSGNTHQVLTAIAVTSTDTKVEVKTQVITTDVSFKQLLPQEISGYWQSGEPQDKAGGYGIQGLAAQFVTNINGSYSSVVGLPLYETVELLALFGLPSPLLVSSVQA